MRRSSGKTPAIWWAFFFGASDFSRHQAASHPAVDTPSVFADHRPMADLDDKAPVHIIGGGLAGSEAAWQLARAGVGRSARNAAPATTAAHKTNALARLVCSNSFRSDDRETNAVGLLHAEMRRLGSLIMRAADANQVPAGGALAVDRDGFSAAVTAALEAHPLIAIAREEIAGLPPADWDSVIVATGPLTSPALAEAIARPDRRRRARLLRRHRADRPSRHDRHGRSPGSSRATTRWARRHRRRLHQLPDGRASNTTPSSTRCSPARRPSSRNGRGTPYFDGCLPIEVMAERGRETLRHGPMKPVGPHQCAQPDVKAYAVVQLRQDNALGTLFNMVGFQTKLKHGEQARVFRTIPGLEKRRIRAPRRPAPQHLPQFADAARRHAAAARPMPRLRFAGQITGCEGYVESRRHRPARRAASPPPSGSAQRCAPPPLTTAHRRAARPHHRRPHRDDRRRPALLPADERQFRPVSRPSRVPTQERRRQTFART